MRNVTVGLGSFLLGLLCASLLGFGSPQTSIFRQSVVFAQTKPGIVSSTFTLNPFTPTVPPMPRSLSEGNINENQIIQIDGIHSREDTFRNMTLVYGGGAYVLNKARFDGGVNIQLVGAAANTAQFMATFGMIGCPASVPKAPPHINPNAPRIDKVSLTTALSGDFVSPYEGK